MAHLNINNNNNNFKNKMALEYESHFSHFNPYPSIEGIGGIGGSGSTLGHFEWDNSPKFNLPFVIDDSYHNNQMNQRNLVQDDQQNVNLSELNLIQPRLALAHNVPQQQQQQQQQQHVSGVQPTSALATVQTVSPDQSGLILTMAPINPDGSIPLHARRRSTVSVMSDSTAEDDISTVNTECAGLMTTFDSKSSDKSDKKHRCKTCNKRFTRPSSLQTHLYSHTGERPFVCDFNHCGRQFSVVSNLRRHKKIHDPSRSRRRH
ncbi:hypothetical protein V1512DRAFT_266370 [Lipomyces arxii]|uniref:uncharacterized protein n=1 Tax=Lipomyces arxii TaxID=56418 RepID=UPI0034CF5BA9